MKPRVLIFSLTYHPHVGGAEVAVKEITDRLGDRYDFDMVTLRFDRSLPKTERFGNVTVYRLGPSVMNPRVSDREMPLMLRIAKWMYPCTAALKGILLHRTRGYDMTWSMMANHAGFAGMIFKMFHPRVPHVLELQDGRAFNEMKSRQPILRLLWPLYLRVYRCADSIKVISRFLRSEVMSLGVTAPVELIPNGVDISRFSAVVPDTTIIDLKNRFGKKMGDVFLFTASRLVLSRGVEDTIRALRFLPENVKFLIAGDGEDKEKLSDIAQREGVRARVIFAGHMDHTELPALYKVSDIFVRPSIIEGFGNAFVEAFAAGIPVIATPVGGIPDFLSDPDSDPDDAPTGLFCAVRDPESIARSVKRYMESPALVAEITANARNLARVRYDWDLISKSMDDAIFTRLTQ